MAIEIRELLIKVKIEELQTNSSESFQINDLKQAILKECRKEIKKQLTKTKER